MLTQPYNSYIPFIIKSTFSIISISSNTILPLSLALTPDDRWVRISIAVRQYGAEAIRKIVHTVLSASNSVGLFNDLKALINKRPQRAFTNEEKALLQPHSGLVDTSTLDITLIHKIITQCIDGNFICNGKSFVKPTGLKLDSRVIPSLVNSNQSDHAKLIKDLRNRVMHWPQKQMNQYDFDSLWKFLEDLLQRIGLNCSALGSLKQGGYIMSEEFVKATFDIMKEYRKETGMNY